MREMTRYTRIQGVRREMAIADIERGDIIEVCDPSVAMSNIVSHLTVRKSIKDPSRFAVCLRDDPVLEILTRARAEWALRAAEKICRGERVR